MAGLAQQQVDFVFDAQLLQAPVMQGYDSSLAMVFDIYTYTLPGRCKQLAVKFAAPTGTRWVVESSCLVKMIWHSM